MEIEARPATWCCPCRDEAAALPGLLAEVPSGFSVIVVDNGSRDATADVARDHGARVVSEPSPGYGAAVHAGVRRATAEYVAVMDGDGSFDPAELPALLALVVDGRCDLALGRRRPVAAGVWPWHARAGNALVVWWLRRSVGLPGARPRSDAGLPSPGAARPRRPGPPLRLPRRAPAQGDPRRLADRGARRRLPAAGRRDGVEGQRQRAGTARTARDFWRVLRDAARPQTA